jgi:ABC-type nitrate/sulfonate/bicarbonate transport system ATPase subunit
VERHLRMVKLWDFRDRHPYELSGGMKQRVAIARVLANDPHVLLMDEPLGALDALTREHLQEELLEIWRSTAKTVVFVTHSVEEAVFLATRIVVLSPRPGRILADVSSPFSREPNRLNGRAVRSDQRFVCLREEILSHIWKAE